MQLETLYCLFPSGMEKCHWPGRHASVFPCGFLIQLPFIYTSPKPLDKHSFLCKCRDAPESLATAPRGLGNLLEHCWTSPLSLRRSLPVRVLTQTRGRVTHPTELPVSRPGHRAPQGNVAASLASPGKAEGLQQRRCIALCCGHGHGPPAGPLDRPAPGRAQRPGESEHQGDDGEKPAARPSRPVARCPVFSWSVIWKAVRCRAAPIGI